MKKKKLHIDITDLFGDELKMTTVWWKLWCQSINNGQDSKLKQIPAFVFMTDSATGLGAGSFLFLLASQVLIMGVSRCLCCGKALRPSGSRSWANMLFITCWVFFLIAQACLLAGSVRKADHTKYKTVFMNEKLSCETLRKGIFGAGAAFVVFTGIFSELYYVSYSRTNELEGPYSRDTCVRMQNL